MKKPPRLIPLIVTALAVAWLVSAALPPRDEPGTFNVHEFGRLPVVYQGRIKPYDTLARNSLTIISDRQTLHDAEGHKRPAIEWLLDVISNAPEAAEYRVFRIHNHQLLTQLGLKRRPGYRFAFAEIEDQLPAFSEQAAAASRRMASGSREVYDTKVMELYHRVTLYRILADTYWRPTALDTRSGLNEALSKLERLDRHSVPHAIPATGIDEEENWLPMLRAVVEGAMTQDPHPAISHFTDLLDAWAADDVDAFNTSVRECAVELRPSDMETGLNIEAAFNHFAPFYRCAVLYVLAFIFGCFSWLGWTERLRLTAFWLLGTTLLAHTLAILARVYISGYPPITNLYGTAVFIGWGCVAVGLFLEKIYPLGVGNTMSSVIGALTLLIAHFLAGDGDTLQMMQAVLDTKFWLATHVIIINLGYSATFLASGLAGLYIVRGVLTRSLDGATETSLARMTYGVLGFALLLSFLGTVLGGLWADDSWGRFWGWDPKENGALMIVLWNALILHARWGGLIKARGIAVLSVFGGIVTAWSWFGVNQLGVGLHSYGFTDSVAFWLIVFAASQLLLIGLGLLPRHMWRSTIAVEKANESTPPAGQLS